MKSSFLILTAVSSIFCFSLFVSPIVSANPPPSTEGDATHSGAVSEFSPPAEQQPDQPNAPEPPEETPPQYPTPPTVTPPIATPPVITPSTPTSVRYVYIQTEGLNIRKGATTSSAVLGQAQKNTRLAYLAKEGNFYKTYYQNAVAYVSAKAEYSTLKTNPYSTETTEKVIAEGSKLLGTPYVYGAVRYHDGTGRKLTGFSVKKFDCSSLMQYIFYKGAGKNLNLTTRTQVKQGKYVAKKDLKRGDLIFFTNAERYNKTGVERIGHVALFLGDNLILHTASDFAKIEPISNTRWGYYIEARRIL